MLRITPGQLSAAGRCAIRHASQAACHPVTTLRAARRWTATAGRTLRYLWTVRAAIPWPVRVILALAMVIKCTVPIDGGSDEALTAVACLVLQRMRPGLLKACWRAAQVRA